MASDFADAKLLHASLKKLLQEGETPAEQKENAKSLLSYLETVHDFKRKGRRGRVRKNEKRQESQKQLVASRKYYRGKFRKEVQKNKDKLASLVGIQLSFAWIIRTMLADPTLPCTTLAAVFNEFQMQEKHAISGMSISTVRDAFVEILKRMVGQKARRSFERLKTSNGASVPPTVFITHLHDGCDLRMRSYTDTLRSTSDVELPTNFLRLSRGRYSKIQNNFISMTMGTETLPWLTELQPLSKKDGKTLATALISTVNDILQNLLGGALASDQLKPTVVHSITGDAINTNENACRYVLRHFSHTRAWSSRINFRMVVFRCAAHKCNLVSVAAVCGRSLVDE